MRSVIPWSWSSYNDYETCPYRFYEVKIAKNYVEPESEPIIWGNTVHKSIELYGKEGKPMDGGTERFKPIVDKFIALPGETYFEMELAIRVDLAPTGFWDSDAYARGKGDLLKINHKKGLAVDWKTGKVKPSIQLDLMGVMAMAQFPDLEQMTSMFMWFQNPSKPTIGKFTRDDIPRVIGQFKKGVADMQWSEQHNRWPKKPSGLCKRHCPVASCEYHGRGNPGYRR